MRKITAVSDVTSRTENDIEKELDGTEVDNSSAPDLCIVPNDDPATGKFGFIVIDSKDDSRSVACQREVFDSAVVVEHSDADNFKAVLSKALADNYAVFSLDDPVVMRVGFLVLKNNGNELHKIRFSLLAKKE